jgi:hypothetical protein
MSRGFKIVLLLALAAFLLVGAFAIRGFFTPGGADGLDKSLLYFLIAVAYFLPVWISISRNCKAGAGIAVVDIFLGWTFVGWVVALAWAACGERKQSELPAGVSMAK